MYINERIKDIEDIQNGITVEHVVTSIASTDMDKIMYINERIKDIEDIQNGITVEHVVLYDKPRIFSCDGPARQFECGQQRGGHYSCICGVETRNHTNVLCTWKILPMSLDDRQILGILWKKSEQQTENPAKLLKIA